MRERGRERVSSANTWTMDKYISRTKKRPAPADTDPEIPENASTSSANSLPRKKMAVCFPKSTVCIQNNSTTTRYNELDPIISSETSDQEFKSDSLDSFQESTSKGIYKVFEPIPIFKILGSYCILKFNF